MDLTDTFTMTEDQFSRLRKRQKALVKSASFVPKRGGEGRLIKVVLKKKVKFYEFPKTP